jgi:hypothetical protein
VHTKRSASPEPKITANAETVTHPHAASPIATPHAVRTAPITAKIAKRVQRVANGPPGSARAT